MRNLATFVVAALLTASIACAQTNATAPLAPPQPAPMAPTTAQLNNLDAARRIDQKEAIKMVEKHKAVWVDVRPKEAYEQGHIKGALNIPLGELMTRLKELPPGKFIITYCA